jgi:Tfp pilus assembly protein PilO
MKFGLREIVFIVLLMAIPMGAYWFVFRPQNIQNEEMRKHIEAKQAKLRELNKATGTIGDLRAEITSLTEAIDYFQSKLPSEKEVDKILQEIWLMAENNELAAKSIRTLERNSSRSFLDEHDSQAEQPIAVQLEGDFRGFYSFLLALENQPRIMRIRQMKVEKLREAEQGQIKVDFEMSIFFEKDKGKPWPNRSM